jgi:hypothetical protein
MPPFARVFLPAACLFALSAAPACAGADAASFLRAVAADAPASSSVADADADADVSPGPPALPDPRARLWQTGILRGDRLQHGSLSMTLALASGLVTRDAAIGLGLSLAFGLAKEIYDIRGNGFDPVDLVADALGAVVGTGATAAVLD